jgi:hypothetical protein
MRSTPRRLVRSKESVHRQGGTDSNRAEENAYSGQPNCERRRAPIRPTLPGRCSGCAVDVAAAVGRRGCSRTRKMGQPDPANRENHPAERADPQRATDTPSIHPRSMRLAVSIDRHPTRFRPTGATASVDKDLGWGRSLRQPSVSRFARARPNDRRALADGPCVDRGTGPLDSRPNIGNEGKGVRDGPTPERCVGLLYC